MPPRPPSPDPSATRTRQAAPSATGLVAERVPALTLLAHARVERIGDRTTLFGLQAGEEVLISRTTPNLAPPGGGRARALDDPFLSRDPFVSLEQRAGVVYVRRRRDSALVRIDGQDVAGEHPVAAEELDRGVVIEVGGRVVFLLHRLAATQGRRPPRFDLVGDSEAVDRLRRDLARMAATDLRVLIRGETGTGKELAARAIHAASVRAKGPYVAVNMGAVQPSLAASELFGHVRGAFSGAVADHEGHIAAASGGTLFLDEIGDTDAAVQAMLLRTLETSEVQRIGDRRVRKVDLRLLSATDADLEAAVAEGKFREPLLHRIGELTLRVPSLRERRDDIGGLVLHFLRELLDADEQKALLDGGAANGDVPERPWLTPVVVARLARAPWTGNVRQLRNVVRQLVVLGRSEEELMIAPELESILNPASAALAIQRSSAPPDARVQAPPSSAKSKSKRPQDLTEDEILEALAACGWRRAAAADRLGIARSSLYTLIAANKQLAQSQDLTREQAEEVLAGHGGDVSLAATSLRVSEHALKLRLRSKP